MLTWNGSAFESKHIDNPADALAGLRVSTTLGAEGLDVFVGNFGNDALAIVDPVASSITAAALHPPQLRALRPRAPARPHPRRQDRRLPATALDLIPAHDTVPSGEGAVKPGLAVGVDGACVSDPRSGKVYEVDVEGFTLGRTFDVGGAPAGMQVVSASAELHEHEDRGPDLPWWRGGARRGYLPRPLPGSAMRLLGIPPHAASRVRVAWPP